MNASGNLEETDAVAGELEPPSAPEYTEEETGSRHRSRGHLPGGGVTRLITGNAADYRVFPELVLIEMR